MIIDNERGCSYGKRNDLSGTAGNFICLPG